MKEPKTNRHNVFLNDEQENALQEIMQIKNLGELKTTSKIIRFIILDYHKMLLGDTLHSDIKLKAITKQLSVIENIVCLLARDIPADISINKENVVHFWKATQAVDQEMNRSKYKINNQNQPEAIVNQLNSNKNVDVKYLKAIQIKKNNDELETLLAKHEQKKEENKKTKNLKT